MADLICISAREESEIIPSLKNYLIFADRVILARHPASPLINFNHDKLTQFHGDENFLSRLGEALGFSTSKAVFLAADDDFYIPSSAKKITSIIEGFENFSCISSMTLYLSKISKDLITLNPYLASSELIKSNSTLSGELSFNSYVLKYFSPLAVDFYSLYSSEHLKSIVNMFLRDLSHSSLAAVGTSMKLFQYLFSLSLVLTGDIVPISYPLYVRGFEQALRRQASYQNNVIQPNELKSFTSEVNQFLGDKLALSEFSKCLYSLVVEKYPSRLQYFDKFTFSQSYISKLVSKILQISAEQIRLDTLTPLTPKYQINVVNSKAIGKPQISQSSQLIQFTIPYSCITDVTFPPYIQNLFQPFLLAPQYLHDIKSCCSSIWKSTYFS